MAPQQKNYMSIAMAVTVTPTILIKGSSSLMRETERSITVVKA
jgi:hypothetical protein